MPAPRPRTLLVLGRVSNLPTVWTNCLAAWLLAGGGDPKRLALLLPGVSCLYVGGMFLNDACDADFDRQHRQERPIPSGHITQHAVWAWASALLLVGLAAISFLGMKPLGVALALTATIVAYDLWHKKHPLTLGLMAGCRFLLYALAAVAAAGGVSTRVLAAAGGLAGYVLGISLLARNESGNARPPRWPLLLLLAPVIPVARQLITSPTPAAAPGCIMFGLWLTATLVPLWQPNASPGRAVGRLLAGLVLVDFLQVSPLAPAGPVAVGAFGLFVLTLLLQRRVPAT